MPPRPAPFVSRRDRLRHRALPVAAVALVAFVVGMIVGALHVSGEQKTVEAFVGSWRKADYAAMQAKLTDAQRQTIDAGTLAAGYRATMETATIRSYDIGKPKKAGDHVFTVPVTVHTASFGDIKGTIRIPLAGDGDDARVLWSQALTFPGLTANGTLERHTTLGDRGTLLARDNTPVDASIKGDLGPIPADQLATFRAAGYPDDAQVGVSGLEKIFERRLAGTPGGELLVGGKVIATHPPSRGEDVRTTISPPVQAAAVNALAGRLGGAVAMNPRTGEVLAAAGIAFSGLQPPGSTFKMITATGALQDGIATLGSRYEYASQAVLSGVPLRNANGEVCGGTLLQAFAISCNSVFAPLGAKLGAKRLISVAERFGFNKPSPIPGAEVSVIPPADEIGDDLALGASAIGQGRVQATTLQMAIVAAAIGNGGRLPKPHLDYVEGNGARYGARATTAKVAREVRRMMVEVVRNGTGVRAAIPGVVVAGKTGTAELRTTQPCVPQPDNPESCAGQTVDPTDTTDTDAWFAAFAPARHPRVAVGVMLVSAGAGGDTAAPAARTILEEALRRT